MAVGLGDCATASEAYKNFDASSKKSLLRQVEELSSKEIPVTSRDYGGMELKSSSRLKIWYVDSACGLESTFL